MINSVTREPIARALVYCPDNRFATLTNSEGRFEFTVAKTAADPDSDSNPSNSQNYRPAIDRPFALLARKPGYMSDPSHPSQNLQNEPVQDVTLTLVPESLIVGTVTLPTSEAPDSITLQVFRRQVQDGRAHWVLAGGTQSKSDGQFRFAELPAGTYKLLTQELLDRDPLTSDPRVDPFASDAGGPSFGYPPIYYQSAPDFGSASAIPVAAGQTAQANLTLVKQPYYRVRIPVVAPAATDPNGAPLNGLNVNVYPHGRKGPGFSLAYNYLHHAIEGLLPDGTYIIEASSMGPNGLTGWQTITIRGAPIDGLKVGGTTLTLLPNASIPVNVKEEFTAIDHSGAVSWNINGRNTTMKGPRRYLNVTLESVDDFGVAQSGSLRNPSRGDDPLVIDAVPPGRYWVRINSSRGYPASVHSGNLDLLHQPLVVAAGGGSAPIEITMRDDSAEISGTVEGVTPPARTPISGNFGVATAASYPTAVDRGTHIYCIPLPDSPGQFTEIWVNTDGSFVSQGIAPGAYRLLAFDRPQSDLEYRNPEAMRAYDSKGPVIRLVGGQKERVTLQLISTSISSNEPSN